MPFFAAIASICFAGGLLSGLAGFGALILIVPMLVMLLGIDIAVPLGVLCGLASQTFNAVSYRSSIHKKALTHMLLGSLPGMLFGVCFLRLLPEPVLRAVLGVLLMVYVIWSLAGKASKPDRPPGVLWVYVAGFFSGAFGGAFGINGPPVVVYATRTGWTPDAIRAFIGVFCAVLFAFLTVMFWLRGAITGDVWLMSLLAVPACLAGGVCGRSLARRMNAAAYMRAVFLLLFIMGVSLCLPAIRAYMLPQ